MTQHHLGNHQSDSKSYGETCNNTLDYRISGVTSLCSRAAGYNTREQGQEVDREVREPPAQGILQDLNQTQKINKFTQESQGLIADMNNTEIFVAKILPNTNVLTAMPTGK